MLVLEWSSLDRPVPGFERWFPRAISRRRGSAEPRLLHPRPLPWWGMWRWRYGKTPAWRRSLFIPPGLSWLVGVHQRQCLPLGHPANPFALTAPAHRKMADYVCGYTPQIFRVSNPFPDKGLRENRAGQPLRPVSSHTMICSPQPSSLRRLKSECSPRLQLNGWAGGDQAYRVADGPLSHHNRFVTPM